MLITDFPSGFKYNFTGINIEPLKFAQLLEYVNESPKSELGKFFLDYAICKQDDKNVDNLLLTDFSFISYLKKCLTMNRELKFDGECTCSIHGNKIQYRVSTSDLKFNKLDDDLLRGLKVTIGGMQEEVRMPSVGEFVNMMKFYRVYQRDIDFKLLKLISLFRNAPAFPGKYEELVTGATYSDITLLMVLEDLYLTPIEPIKVTCPQCAAEGRNGGKVAVSISSLATDLFRKVIECNKLTSDKILFK